jgi:hypothetical protein
VRREGRGGGAQNDYSVLPGSSLSLLPLPSPTFLISLSFLSSTLFLSLPSPLSLFSLSKLSKDTIQGASSQSETSRLSQRERDRSAFFVDDVNGYSGRTVNWHYLYNTNKILKFSKNLKIKIKH